MEQQPVAGGGIGTSNTQSETLSTNQHRAGGGHAGGAPVLNITNANQVNVTGEAKSSTHNYHTSSAIEWSEKKNAVRIPSELLPLKKEGITLDHAKKWFDYYQYFNPNMVVQLNTLRKTDNSAGEKIDYTEPAGKIFRQDLLNLHGDIVEQSTEAFESHCVNKFSSVGIKVAGEDIREFNHIKCLLFSSEMKAKYDEDPFLPLRLTFQYIHSNSDTDNFSQTLVDYINKWGIKTCSTPFYIGESMNANDKQGKPRSGKAHNIVRIGSNAACEVKKKVQEWEEKAFGMSVRLQKSAKISDNYWQVPVKFGGSKKVYLRVKKNILHPDCFNDCPGGVPDENQLLKKLAAKSSSIAWPIYELVRVAIQNDIDDREILDEVSKASDLMKGVLGPAAGSTGRQQMTDGSKFPGRVHVGGEESITPIKVGCNDQILSPLAGEAAIGLLGEIDGLDSPSPTGSWQASSKSDQQTQAHQSQQQQ